MQSVDASFDGGFSGIGVEFNILRDTVIVVNTIVGVRPSGSVRCPTTGLCVSTRSTPWG